MPRFHGKDSGNLINSVLKNEHFTRCLTNTATALVLQGKPGVGKSTTMLGLLRKLDKERIQESDQPENLLPDHVENKQATANVVVASIFFKAEIHAKEDAQGVLMCLLQQLVEKVPGALNDVRQLAQEHQNIGPTAKDIADTTISVLKKTTKACFFLDALDEHNSNHAFATMKHIARVQYESKVGLVITDREGNKNWHSHFKQPNAAFETLLSDDGDIATYLDEQVSSFDEKDSSLTPSKETCERAKETIQRASGNM